MHAHIYVHTFLVFGVEAADLTSTTTGLDLDSMLDRSDSDLSTTDARTIRKQLEGLENMYSEVSTILFNRIRSFFFIGLFFREKKIVQIKKRRCFTFYILFNSVLVNLL